MLHVPLHVSSYFKAVVEHEARDVDRNLRLAHKGFQPNRQFVEVPDLALPNPENIPAERFDLFYFRSVSVNISLEFGQPIIEPGLRKLTLWTAVPVPETSVHEDRLAMTRQDDVGTARKIFTMQAEAIAQPVQNLPDDKLRLGVLLFNGLHDPSALLRRASVHHCFYKRPFSLCTNPFAREGWRRRPATRLPTRQCSDARSGECGRHRTAGRTISTARGHRRPLRSRPRSSRNISPLGRAPMSRWCSARCRANPPQRRG